MLSPSFFASSLLEWYEINKRDLPWRDSNDPYIIWLSEIILQQTRVNQGLPYFTQFIRNFPDIKSLALASEDEIFKLWQGLGYYSRARNLHAAAKSVLADFDGKFPTKYEDVIGLKGVGEYTAAAIMSFAYNEPFAVVDGNVFRLLSRVFGVKEFIDTGTGKKVFKELAFELLDKNAPGLYNQAIMDFGALQCVPFSPDCLQCPFVDKCYAHNNGETAVLPKKKGKITVKKRFFNYLDIRLKNSVFIRKRLENDIWQGLYEFPLIETKEDVSFQKLIESKEYLALFERAEKIEVVGEYTFKHVLSHQIIHAKFYQIQTDYFDNSDFEKVKESDLHIYAISKMIDNYLSKL